MPKVLFIGDIHPAGHKLFDTRPEFERVLFENPSKDDLLRNIADADAVIVRKVDLPADVIDKATKLKIASRHGVGCENVDVPALTARGIPVTVVGDANSSAVAEHAMMLILAAARRLPKCMALVRTTEPDERNAFLDRRNYLDMMELEGKTLLILGFGRIGRKLAKRCAAFDMDVVIADPFVAAAVVEEAGYRHVSDFTQAIGEADCVVLALPADPKAPPMFQAPEFAAMKEGAIFVNVARGSLVDDADLAAAVKSGHLFNAAIDVWHHMPPELDHPFLELPDMVLTPHCSALTEACLIRMATISVQNVFDFFDGKLDPRLVFNQGVLGQECA